MHQALLGPSPGLPQLAAPCRWLGTVKASSCPAGSHGALSSEPALSGGLGTAASLASVSAPLPSGKWVPASGGTPVTRLHCTPLATCLSNPVTAPGGDPWPRSLHGRFLPQISAPPEVSDDHGRGSESSAHPRNTFSPGKTPAETERQRVTEGRRGKEAGTGRRSVPGKYLGRRTPGAAGASPAAPRGRSSSASWPFQQPRWLQTPGGWPGSPGT